MANFTPPPDIVSEKRKKFEAQYTNQDQQRGYNIGTFEYPEGLRVKPDLQNYVAFYINVRDRATGGKTQKNKDYYVSEREQARLNAISRNNISVAAAEEGVKTIKNNIGAIIGAAGAVATIAAGGGPKKLLMGGLKTAGAALAGTLGVTGNSTFNSGVTIIGNLGVTGSITSSQTITTLSDYRIKTKIEPLLDETVEMLNPCKYYNTLSNKDDYGFIAHEVQEIFPLLVNGDKDGEDYQSLNYIGLIPILVKEIKDLKNEIKKIKKDIIYK
jgi:hypothetical protein